MIMDERLEFADALALNTGGVASYLLGDVVDLGATPSAANGNRDIGQGDTGIHVVITIDTTATSGGAAIGTFHLVSDAQAALAVDGTATYHVSSAAIAVATLVAGFRVIAIALPSGTYERYLGILQQTAGAAFTAGKINAFLTREPGKYISYPQALGAGA